MCVKFFAVEIASNRVKQKRLKEKRYGKQCCVQGENQTSVTKRGRKTDEKLTPNPKTLTCRAMIKVHTSILTSMGSKQPSDSKSL